MKSLLLLVSIPPSHPLLSPTSLQVVLCVVSSVTSHGHHRHRKNKKDVRCGVQHYTVQETGYRQECHQVYESHCEEVYREHCEQVVEYREECHHANPGYGYDNHHHHHGAYQQCHQVPQHHQVCHKVPEKVCSQHPRQECRQVPVSVPRTAARRVCHRY